MDFGDSVEKDEPGAEDKRRGQLLMTLGALARYFKTPIDFFENQSIHGLDEWIEVMNEMIRLEQKEIDKAQRG
jgi:hypothetical protein